MVHCNQILVMTVLRNWEGWASQNIPIIPCAEAGKKAQELKASVGFTDIVLKKENGIRKTFLETLCLFTYVFILYLGKNIPGTFCLFLWSQIRI